jgi:uncharacterized protein DUF1353
MPFTTAVLISPIAENGFRTVWRVHEPLNFHSDKFGKNYVVPKDTVTDLANGIIPAAAAASLLHDHLYERGVHFRQVKSRAEADDVFFEAMLDSGVPLWRCWTYFLLVRAFGTRFYKPK